MVEADAAGGALRPPWRFARMAIAEIPDDWTPTAANVNALPEPLRRYIMQLETHRDPQLTLQLNYELQLQVQACEAMIEKLRPQRKRPPAPKSGGPGAGD